MSRWRVSFSAVLVCWGLLASGSPTSVIEGREEGGTPSSGTTQWPLYMPQAQGIQIRHNDYRCRAFEHKSNSQYIVQYEPRADPSVAHHMLVFGCRALRHRESTSNSWSCKSSTICAEFESPRIIYAWALNASGFQLPPHAGQEIGGTSGINFVVVQVHYGAPQAATNIKEEQLALILHMTQERQQYISGVYLLGSGADILPRRETYNVDTACQFRGPNTITPIAFRTHAHSLSTVIVGYVGDGVHWKEIGHRSPQDPQAFYPAQDGLTIKTGDWVVARCVYNTSDRAYTIHMGPDSEDEMCNFYIMYYTLNNGLHLTEQACWIPAPSYIHYPPTPTLPPSHASHHHQHNPMGGTDNDFDPTPPGTLAPDKAHQTTPTPASTGSQSKPTELSTKEKEEKKEKEEEEEEEEEYVCPNSIPPGPPTTLCPAPTSLLEREGGGGGGGGEVGKVGGREGGGGGGGKEGAQIGGGGGGGENEPSKPAITTPTHPPKYPDSGLDESETVSDNPLVVLAEDWPLNGMDAPEVGGHDKGVQLGQVTSVAVDTDGSVLVLHRGPREWDYSTFTMSNVFAHPEEGPIAVPTLLKFSSRGDLLQSWASDVFYLPHSVTVDSKGNVWVTDVAMHQVFQFPGVGEDRASLSLGHKLIPGGAPGYFCKPAAVAVETSGVFYVADGYCNSRVIQYFPSGLIKQVWSYPVGGTSLLVPHDLALSSNEETLYVADRENYRILSYPTSGRGGAAVFSRNHLLKRVFGIGLESGEWPMYTISITKDEKVSYGLNLNSSGAPIRTWGPKNVFSRPHDLALDPSGPAMYVAELNPPRVWKFIRIQAGSVHKVDSPHTPVPPTDTDQFSSSKTTTTTPPPETEPFTDPTGTTSTSTSSTSMSTPSTNESTPSTRPVQGTQTTHVSSGSTSTSTTGMGTPPTQQLDKNGNETDADMPSPSSSPSPSPFSSSTNLSTSDASNATVDLENATPSKSKTKPPHLSTPTYHYGLFAALLGIVALILVVVVAILKEHRFCRFGVRRISPSEKVKQSKQPHPRDTLNSLLGPSQLGFSRLRTYDSDSEVEEFPIFSRP